MGEWPMILLIGQLIEIRLVWSSKENCMKHLLQPFDDLSFVCYWDVLLVT